MAGNTAGWGGKSGHFAVPLLPLHLCFLYLLGGQDLREECIKLKKRVFDLERQNQMLKALLQQKLQLTTGSLPQVGEALLLWAPLTSALSSSPRRSRKRSVFNTGPVAVPGRPPQTKRLAC